MLLNILIDGHAVIALTSVSDTHANFIESQESPKLRHIFQSRRSLDRLPDLCDKGAVIARMAKRGHKEPSRINFIKHCRV
jgi:hypothetical protein